MVTALVVWGIASLTYSLSCFAIVGVLMIRTNPDYPYAAQEVFYPKFSFAFSVLYFTIAGTTKLGILLMYNRIFSLSTAFRYQLLAVSGLVGWWVGCTVAALTSCIPFNWNWINSAAKYPGYCFNYNVLWMSLGA